MGSWSPLEVGFSLVSELHWWTKTGNDQWARTLLNDSRRAPVLGVYARTCDPRTPPIR